MLPSFKSFLAEERLDEKLIVYGGGAKYGQVVFVVGGGGSGKGFAINNFMDANAFKRRDVDEYKLAFLALGQIREKHAELRSYDLRNPDDVFKLHSYVKQYNVKNKTLDLLLADLSTDRLPNILFDVTGKDLDDITGVVPRLIECGYNPKNINITWVLTNFEVAIKNNAGRARVVPADVLLDTHSGAAKTMTHILHGNVPHGVDGQINVVLNNRENTIPFVDEHGKPIKRASQILQKRDIVTKELENEASIVVKDFMYVRVKEAGKPMKHMSEVQHDVFDWIKTNVPKQVAAELFA